MDVTLSTNACNETETTELLQLVNNEQLKESVKSISFGADPCNLNTFDLVIGPFKKAESVAINYQHQLKINQHSRRLNDIFPLMRKLNLHFNTTNNLEFVDCEILSLDELTISGGLITNNTYDSTFDNFLVKNPLIQRLTVKKPTYRTFELLQKYSKRLEEIHILSSVYKSDRKQPELFFPNVKILEINLDGDCHQPYEVTFGGEELQELHLNCPHEHIDYEFFNTLNRYPNIATLTATSGLENRDLLRMIGKFPQITKATTDFSKNVTSDSISKFIEKSNKLKKMSFKSHNLENPDEMEKQLQTRIGGNFIITMREGGDITHFTIISSATKHVTSSVSISLIVLYLSRTFSF